MVFTSRYSSWFHKVTIAYLLTACLLSPLPASAQEQSPVPASLPSLPTVAAKSSAQPAQAKKTPPIAAPRRSIDPVVAANSFTVASQLPLSGRLAFTATVHDVEGIFVLDFETKSVTPIVLGPGNNKYPAISPDGEHIAFTSDRDGNEEIYLADWDGANVLRVTTNTVADIDPTWIPRTKGLLFSRIKGADPSVTTDFVAATIDSKFDAAKGLETIGVREAILTTLGGRNVTPAWTPIKDLLTFSTNRFWPGWDICAWQVDAKQERCLLGGQESFGRARWSPDGLNLAFSFSDGRNMNLGMSQLGKPGFKKLTSQAGNEYDAEWYSDGEYIAFVANKGTSQYQPYILKLEDMSVSSLFTTVHSIRYLSWSPVKTVDLEIKRIRRNEERAATIAAAAPPTPPVTPTIISDVPAL